MIDGACRHGHPFAKSFERVILIEGGYVNDPADLGGATRYGITEAVARRHDYRGPMSALPLATARAIYRHDYWDRLQLSDVATYSDDVAERLFDAAVNAGTGLAGRWLQRALNVLNNQGTHYADLTEDGIVRPRTIAALKRYLQLRGSAGETVLLRVLGSLQGYHYISLAERRQKDERFVFGWFLQRID